MTDLPMVWTSKGNLPIEDLEYRYQWDFPENEIVFVEEYWLGDECVKRSPHIYIKTAAVSNTEVGNF